MNDVSFNLRDYLVIARRRKWYLIIPFVLVALGAVVVASTLPPVYRSDATILIEDPEVPDNIVASLVSDYVEKRLEAISRRVMVTESLSRIIERYDLYPEPRKRLPMATVVETMRANIRRDMIRADVIDPRSGQKRSLTVAFKLSFDYGNPETAQRITNELVTLYLNENLRQRREMAAETVTFLRGEREHAEQRIREIEIRLADFKQANAGALPDNLVYNQTMLARAEESRRTLDLSIQALKEQESYLTAQLAQTSRYLPLTAGAPTQTLGPAAQLDLARGQLATLATRYGPDHPDVVRLRREVDGLGLLVDSSGDRVGAESEQERLAGELVRLRERYSEEHPDVRRAKRELDKLEISLSATAVSKGDRDSRSDATNPAYITLQAQLAALRTELTAAMAQRANTDKLIDGYQQAVLKTPLVEREYAQLQRTLHDATALRAELAQKETLVSLGQSLESELKAERLSLIEPPSLPNLPYKPDRKRILFLGLVLAMGTGGGSLTLRYALEEAVWAPKDIAKVTGMAPLVVIPRIFSPWDRVRQWTTAGAVSLAMAAVLGAGGYWVHTRYMPLDVLAYDLQRRTVARIEGYLPDRLRPLLLSGRS